VTARRDVVGDERGRDLLPRALVLVRTWHPGSLPSSRVLNADDEPRLTRSEGDKVIASPRLRNASVLPPHPILPTIVRRQYARRIAQAGRGNVHCGGCDCNGEGVKCLATKKEARDRAALPSSDSVTNTSRLVRGPILVSPPPNGTMRRELAVEILTGQWLEVEAHRYGGAKHRDTHTMACK